MKTELQTRCTEKKHGTTCKGGLFKDLSISKLEESLGHRIYKCDKCGTRFKFT